MWFAIYRLLNNFRSWLSLPPNPRGSTKKRPPTSKKTAASVTSAPEGRPGAGWRIGGLVGVHITCTLW